MFEKILGSNGGKKLERAGLIAALTFVLTSCGNDIKKLVGTEPKPATVATEKVPNVVDVTSALNSPATPTVAPSPVAAPVQTGKLNEVEDENSGYKGYEKGQRVNGKDLYRNGSYRLLLEKIQKNLKYPFLIIDFTKFSADEKSEMYDAYRAMAKEYSIRYGTTANAFAPNKNGMVYEPKIPTPLNANNDNPTTPAKNL